MRGISSEVHKRTGAALTGVFFAVMLATSAWAWGETDTATTAATAATTTSSGTLTTTQATDCTTCHGADVVEGHHQSANFLNGNCAACHQGITTSGDCSTCHTFSLQNNTHHLAQSETPIDCSLCHSGSNNLQNCLGCHSGKVGNRHHEVAAAFNADCSACHPGATAATTCQECHNASREQHHSVAQTQSIACNSCHSNIVTPQNCQSCHPAGSKRDSHHTLAKQGGLECHTCHAPIPSGSFGTGCSQCHTPGSNRDFHHQAVMTGQNLTCTNCHSGAATISGCNTCHQGQTSAIHHASANYQSGNCSACHTSSGLDQSGCRSCHHFMPEDPLYSGNIHHNSTYIWNQYQLGCYDCHSKVGGVFQPPPASNCIFCHEGVVKATGIQATHHATATATSGQCNICHSGSTPTSGLDCAGCHLGNGNPPAVVTHHSTSAYSSGQCSTCHTGIAGGQTCTACHTSPPGSTLLTRHHNQYAPSGALVCASCHTGSDAIFQSCETSGCHTPSGGTITSRHHMTIPAQMQQCATCHTGVDTTSLACSQCHQTADGVPIAERHHTSATAQTGNCLACHSQVSAQEIPCSTCHSGGNHHLQPQATAGDCAYCHGTTQLVGGSCAGCHTAPIPQIHHGDPLTAVNGNCAVCHQSASTPDSCGTCHTSTPHHSTTWSQTGDCAHCHAIPAWAADRPAQAACRECHGTSMHDKGGPVQNYGACAACHNTTPFHAYNGSDTSSSWGGSRDDRSRGGNGPGYDKFNMFSRQNLSRGEEGRDAPRNKLTFSTKSISHAGKSYTVPYFTGMASGNLALKKTATASRSESSYNASLAVDGDVATRWWAKSTATQWLKVDLGAVKTINKVALRWHSYYATEYEVRVSTDNSTWTRVADANYGKGGLETWTFTGRNVRYIQIYCQRASSSNGFAIYELEAYAP